MQPKIVCGFIDKIDTTGIRGWAGDARNPAEPLLMELVIDRQAVARLSCSQLRPDVKGAGFSTPYVGFYAELPSWCLDGTEHTLELRAIDGHVLNRADFAVVEGVLAEIDQGPWQATFTLGVSTAGGNDKSAPINEDRAVLPSQEDNAFLFERTGFCTACLNAVTFKADSPYFRNSLLCPACGSVPRNRALMHLMDAYFPDWQRKRVHESSPGWDIVSARLAAECSRYTATHYDQSIPLGEIVSTALPCRTYRNENLECQTFPNEAFDIVVMQDVFEHVFFPDRAIREIARTLSPGGALIMTVPILMTTSPSRRRSSLIDGKIVHHHEAQYHGDPIRSEGTLVTIDWGYDIVSYPQHHSEMSFILSNIDNPDHGILGDLKDVIIGFKRPIPAL